jgi:hypothetical protein
MDSQGKSRLNTNENDPDTLQIQDELDEKWLRNWRKAISKRNSRKNGLTVMVSPQEKARSLAVKTKGRT